MKCHRRLLADYLVACGVEVRHISSGVRADPHALDPAAVVSNDRVAYPPAEAVPPPPLPDGVTPKARRSRTAGPGRPTK